jgi:hypothetical protein
MSDPPGAAMGVVSWACAGLALLLFVATAAQGSGPQGLDGLVVFGAKVVTMLGAFLFAIMGAVCGATSVSAAAAAGDRRRRTGLPLLANVLAILIFIAYILSSKPPQTY